MEINSTSLKNSFGLFLRRYHMLVFAFFVLGGLTVCMFLINGVINKSGDTSGYTPQATNTSFDKDTMQRIKELRDSSNSAGDDLDLSSGRSNPFVE